MKTSFMRACNLGYYPALEFRAKIDLCPLLGNIQYTYAVLLTNLLFPKRESDAGK